jgi:protein-tyrosine phosphatase
MNKTAIPVFCAALTLCACYTEITPEEPSARGGLLPIAGAYNVRDIGGYRAAGGKTVKWGVLIRSGDLNMLTGRDQDYLFNKMGIKTVVDFRSTLFTVDENWNPSTERSQAPDRLPADVVVWDQQSGKVSTAIPESTVVPAYEDILRDQVKYRDEQAVINEVIAGYKRLITDPTDPTAKVKAAYKSFFEALLDRGGAPVLFHCSAGKDRAGVASALLLKALGVSDADIIANYMLSRDFVAEKYYPVVPFVIKNTRDQMNQMLQLVPYLDVPDSNNGKLKEILRPQLEPQVRQGYMTKLMNDYNVPEATARVNAQNWDLDSGDGLSALTTAFGLAIGGIRQLQGMTPAMVEAQAQASGDKIKPLLTVDERYIRAALEEVGDINIYLTGLGLPADTITRLKDLYLE